MRKPVYLDYAATTPVDPVVAALMVDCLTLDGNFANPASRSHMYGWQAEEAVESARDQVANLINADPREVIWTSGATESNNLAIKGVSQTLNGKHIITSKIEHKAVLDVCEIVAASGCRVTYLQPDNQGLIAPELVAQALQEDTVLVSLMHVNNEIGVVTDVASIGAMCRSRGILFHVDAAQSAGKLPIDVVSMNIDLLSISAHKMYGPKGIGALYVRRSNDITIEAQIHGGGHERGMRSGTLPTHQIVGLGEAARIASTSMATEQERILKLKNRFWQQVKGLDSVFLNGSAEQRVAGNLNICFSGVDGETLMMTLRELALSSGSACTSASLEPSYVLKAIGVNREDAHSSLRFSFGRFTSEDDIDFAIEKVKSAVSILRKS